MKKNQLKILMVSDSPDSILSYGLLGKMLVDRLYKYYDIHYLSLQRTIGIPFKRDGKYTKHAARPEGHRDPTSLPYTIQTVRPNIVWTNFDVQVYETFLNKNYVPKSVSWIGWLPWDNEDVNQLRRTKRAYSNVDAKIAISQFGLQFLSTKIKMDGYIYNIADTDSFYPLSDEDENGKLKKFKEKLKWYDKNDKYIMYAGRPNWRKCMIHMMAIRKELNDRGRDDIKLILHSNIRDPASESNLPEVIEAFRVKNLITNSFFYDEGISKGDLNCYYNIADLYIAPHRGEGFCMPIVEAMAAGTPFVASDICTTKEFAGENSERGFPAPVYYPKDEFGRPVLSKGVLRPYPKVKEFADTIEKALEDENRLETMGEKGVRWARKHCSPAVVAAAWKNVFDSFDVKVGKVEDYK